MGNNKSVLPDGFRLPLTPNKLEKFHSEEQLIVDFKIPESPEPSTNLKDFDPRSPNNVYRTPINEIIGKRNILNRNNNITRKINLTSATATDDRYSSSAPSSLSNILKQRMIKEGNYENLVDPRSPSQNIDRTPIKLTEDNCENLELSNASVHDITLETNENVKILNKNITKLRDGEIDPRSPSLNIKRTPIALYNSVPVHNKVVSSIDITPNAVLQCTNYSVDVDIIKKNTNDFNVTETNTNQIDKESILKSNFNIYVNDENKDYCNTPKRTTHFKEFKSRTPLGCAVNNLNRCTMVGEIRTNKIANILKQDNDENTSMRNNILKCNNK